jgi:phosphocarrier protein
MTSKDDPLWRDMMIVNELGLHARAAAKLAKTAQQAVGRVYLQAGSESVDAKQVIDILTLAAGRGNMVRIRIENATDSPVLNRIAKLFTNGFGE